jgi:hypothetical protein
MFFFYSVFQLTGGMLALLVFRLAKGLEAWLPKYPIDWRLGRWPLLFALSGMVCMLASLMWMKK